MKKALLILAGLLVLLILVPVVFFFLRPLSVYAWFMRRSLSQAGLKLERVAAPEGPVAVWKGGTGPVLVLLHGAGDHAGAFGRVAQALSSTYTLVIPDLPGHGDSAPEAGPLSVKTLLDGTLAVLNNAVPAGRATVVGNSLGGWLAVLAAREAPERVERVVLVNGGPLRHVSKGLTLTPRTIEEARTLMDALRAPGSVPIASFVLRDVIRQAKEGPISRIAQTASDMEPYVMDGKLSSLGVPLDVIWGTSDRLLPLDYAKRILSEVPGARLFEIEGCGHVPQQECPGDFLETLSKVSSPNSTPRGAK